MATFIIQTNGNGSTQTWACSTGTDHEALVDEIYTAPNTSDYIIASQVLGTGSGVDEFLMATNTIGGGNHITDLQVYLYCNRNPVFGGYCRVQLYWEGSWTAESANYIGGAPIMAWESKIWSGLTGSQADLDALQIRLNGYASGDGQVFNVSCIYIIVTYSAAPVTGYGHKVMGISPDNIAKINGVLTANIGKVNGV